VFLVLTEVSRQRSSDGLTLLISSSDGFCSTLSFSPTELGQIYTGDVGPQKATSGAAASASASSTQNTPAPTPTSVFAPPSPYPTGSQHRHRDSASSMTAPSPPAAATFINQRPSSPARSNSASSIITQSSAAPGVVSNPPLIVGQVPSIAATNSAKVTGVPITTPPETPGGSSSAVHTGSKRDTSESELDEASGGQPKRRRIAPTLISTTGSEDRDVKP
jgi:chromatin assembly factor 1 subunit B